MTIKKFFVVIVFLMGFLDVHASEEKIYIGERIPDVYIRKISSTGEETVKQGLFIRRRSDNHFVYCIEPFVSLINNHTYAVVTSNYPEILGVSEENWQKISLIAYYGYQYDSHTADYWYYITQVMIWRIIDPAAEFYFTDSLGSANNPDLFAEEIKEIEDLVAKHNLTPEFEDINVLLGTETRFADKNNVLAEFSIEANDLVTIEGNELLVSGNKLGSYEINLQKNSNNYSTAPIVYYDEESQNVLAPGYQDAITRTITINITGASLQIIKKDLVSKEIIPIADIKFLIYNENDELVLECSTNSEGICETNNVLGIGKYKIIEDDKQIIPGYEINKEPIYFEVTDSNLVTVEFFNEPVTGEVKIIKMNEDNTKLTGVLFGLYQADGSLVDIKETDENGEVLFSNLLLGQYQIKELATIDNYLLSEEVYNIELTIDNYTTTQTVEIINYQPKGSIEIIKTDSNNNYISNTEFTLYDQNMNVLEIVETDVTGKAIINDLLPGKYYIKETKAHPEYQLVTDLIEIEIKENKEIITVNIINEKIEIPIPDTAIEYHIDVFILENKKKINCK